MTQAFNIKVTSKYLGKQDKPQNTQVFVFSYTVNITNNSPEPVKLLSRYWLITNGDGEKVEVQGDGVVGEQPTIEPNQTYSYTSASMLKTEVGTMEGYYRFTRDTTVDTSSGSEPELGELATEFKAQIPVFSLAVPNSLH